MPADNYAYLPQQPVSQDTRRNLSPLQRNIFEEPVAFDQQMDYRVQDQSSRELTMEQIQEIPIDVTKEDKKKRGRKAKAKTIQSAMPQESICSSEKHVHFDEDNLDGSQYDMEGIDISKLTSKKQQYLKDQIVDKNGAYSYLDDPNQYKKARKRLQNRESAVRSRQRKKSHQEELEYCIELKDQRI